MPFHFKQFSVDDSRCAMKVGTDSVLLGAWANLEDANLVLDIGAGCGLLALIAAQKSNALITAIEIDKDASEQANTNIILSKWHDRINCINIGLEEFGIKYKASGANLFDHIITNPPYFIDSLKSPVNNRNQARHNESLSLSSLVEWSSSLLSDSGKLSLVFPFSNREFLIQLAACNRLNLSRELTIIPKSGKEPNRILLEFTKESIKEMNTDELIIRESNGRYTPEYLNLTEMFYLSLK